MPHDAQVDAGEQTTEVAPPKPETPPGTRDSIPGAQEDAEGEGEVPETEEQAPQAPLTADEEQIQRAEQAAEEAARAFKEAEEARVREEQKAGAGSISGEQGMGASSPHAPVRPEGGSAPGTTTTMEISPWQGMTDAPRRP